MKALMLAAGVARRLYGDENDELPKALLHFNDQSLLQRHIELLQAYGVKELVMIVGHRQDDLIAEAETLADKGFVRPIFNPRYKEGPLLSMAKGIDVLPGGTDVLFMNSDVLYHPLILEKLIRSPHRNCFIMDRQFQSNADQVLVCVNGGEVVDFGKGLGEDFELFGEWPGFLKISGEIAAKVANVAPVDVPINKTRRPIARPMASASSMSRSQRSRLACPNASPSSPCPVNRAKYRLAPSASATLSGTGRISSDVAEKPCR